MAGFQHGHKEFKQKAVKFPILMTVTHLPNLGAKNFVVFRKQEETGERDMSKVCHDVYASVMKRLGDG